MKAALTACIRAFSSLRRGAMFWHLLWPGLVSLALWAGLALAYWGDMVALLMGGLRGLPWVGDLVQGGTVFGIAATVVVHFLLVGLLLPLVYVTTLPIVGVFALPLMLEQVAQREYATLEARHGGSLIGSLVNALLATLLFALLLILTLPLWWVPGLGVALPILLSAWLNQRIYRYDALMQHADRDELRLLQKQCRGGLYLVGLGTGLLAWVPLANLLAPAFAGLASVHYCLSALERQRGTGMAVQRRADRGM
jgi:hypothetical protein